MNIYLKIFMCMNVSPECMYVYHMHTTLSPQKWENGFESPETGVKNMHCWTAM